MLSFLQNICVHIYLRREEKLVFYALHIFSYYQLHSLASHFSRLCQVLITMGFKCSWRSLKFSSPVHFILGDNYSIMKPT